jgi:hypothetical protein
MRLTATNLGGAVTLLFVANAMYWRTKKTNYAKAHAEQTSQREAVYGTRVSQLANEYFPEGEGRDLPKQQ